MEKIKQAISFDIEQTTLSVDDLINKTEPDIFNPLTLSGYQRKIVPAHCVKIIDYIMENDFFFPAPVICSTRKNPNGKMWVVDGQHRIEAFRSLKESYDQDKLDKYEEIKNYTVPVIKLLEPDEKDEISTFISINKTGKKVDTSLAHILRNKLSTPTEEEEMKRRAKIDYLCVELAKKINETENSIWEDQISFEDNPKKEGKLISLNGFIKSERTILSKLEKAKLINIDWYENEKALSDTIKLVYDLFVDKWDIIEYKWSQLFNDTIDKRSVIQGPIGCTSINKFIGKKVIDEESISSIASYKEKVAFYIQNIDIPYENWIKGIKYSRFSSESGYSYVASDLEKNLLD